MEPGLSLHLQDPGALGQFQLRPLFDRSGRPGFRRAADRWIPRPVRSGERRQHLRESLTRMHKHRQSAFTLLELLTVIAVIGILAALLFPGIRSARVSANKAKTRVQFNQWAAALEGFRSEYGYYPALHSSNLINPPGQATDPATLHLFHDLLAAQRPDGPALPPP